MVSLKKWINIRQINKRKINFISQVRKLMKMTLSEQSKAGDFQPSVYVKTQYVCEYLTGQSLGSNA